MSTGRNPGNEKPAEAWGTGKDQNRGRGLALGISLRQKPQPFAVRGADDAEVPAVQGRDFRLPQRFADGDHGRIHEPQIEVHVPAPELNGSQRFGIVAVEYVRRSARYRGRGPSTAPGSASRRGFVLDALSRKIAASATTESQAGFPPGPEFRRPLGDDLAE